MISTRNTQLTGRAKAAVQALVILTLELCERRKSIKCGQAAGPAVLYISRGATAKFPQSPLSAHRGYILFP